MKRASAVRPARPRSPEAPRPRSSASDLAVVGIGASAGGLEALELFLGHVPAGSGLAYVVVQHLDPNYKGIVVELLQRATQMPVLQITDRLAIKPDHVYVIPPNRDLSILRGVLHLLEPQAPRGLRLPIDFFLTALAADRQVRAIGVVLSGMGSDGTMGLRAVKENGGAVFVQDPALAKFDGMPRSAIDAGLADVVAPAEDLAARIVGYLDRRQLLPSPPVVLLNEKDQSGLEKVALILRGQTGHDFSMYKKSTLYRRIERRMGLHQLRGIAEYVRYLRENPQEATLLFKELLIGVTSFFRDPDAWEQLKTDLIPALLAARPKGGMLRAWTPACSTGEEAFSLAIVFQEALEQLRSRDPAAPHHALQIFATDLDQDAIDRARVGAYSTDIAANVSAARLRRYFVQDERGYRINKEVRETVIFAPQNLVMDPPFTRLDLLVCRNLLIYLEPELQKKLLPLFHYSLNPGGVLMLGTSETVGDSADLFSALPGNTRLYRRQGVVRESERVDFPTSLARYRSISEGMGMAPSLAPQSAASSLQAQTEALMLARFSPAAVLATVQGDVVYISGKTGKYLEPAAGTVNNNLLAMAREGLAGALGAAFARAVREHSAVTLEDVRIGTNADSQRVKVTVLPLSEPVVLAGMVLVVFSDLSPLPAAPSPSAGARGKGAAATKARDFEAQLAMLRQELQQAHKDAQSTREEMQSSQEELKSINEELQSTNEELQSTNEELATSKEEMQSMNEELQTVNYELQAKLDELSRTSDDMNNLLNSTEIATLFLDGELRVRRFTTQAAGLIKLIPGDAGRPVTDLATELDYPGLAEDAHEVQRTLVFQERRVASRDGRWFAVRIMPYRTQANRIDGVVITFLDITAVTSLETQLRHAQAELQKRYADQTAALKKSRAALKAERSKKP